MNEEQKSELKLENLLLNQGTLQDLTAEETEEAQGGIGLPLHASPRPPQRQPPPKQ
jgi:hypothetical protein